MSKYDWLKEVDSTSLQQALKDLDQAFSNFFRRVRNGENPGFPKFRKKGYKDSFRCVMSLQFEADSKRLKIGKHGWIKVRGTTKLLVNKIKSVTVVKDGNHWYASCLIEVPEPEEQHIHQFEICGIDSGVKRPLTVAYNNKTRVIGTKFSKDLSKKEQKRKRYQRQYARKIKGSANQEKARRKVARAYQKERQFRKNWIEQTSYQLAHRFETVVFEDLKIRNMTKSAKGTLENPGKNVKAKSGLNREMLRLGLSELITRTCHKVGSRQGLVLLVNPRNTSRTCNKCHTVDKASRKNQAKFQCTHCGHKTNADPNAARNIRDLGKLRLAA